VLVKIACATETGLYMSKCVIRNWNRNVYWQQCVCVHICKSHLCCDTLQPVSHVGAWFSYVHRRFICILCPSNVAAHIHCHNSAVHNINLYFVKVSSLLQFSKPDKVLTYNFCGHKW